LDEEEILVPGFDNKQKIKWKAKQLTSDSGKLVRERVRVTADNGDSTRDRPFEFVVFYIQH